MRSKDVHIESVDVIWRRVKCVLINFVFGYFQDFGDHPRLQQHPRQARVSGMWCYNVIMVQFREEDESNGANNMTGAHSLCLY